MINALNEEFNKEYNYRNFSRDVDEITENIKNEAEKEFIVSFIDAFTSHIGCEAFSYWDGRNWRSITTWVDYDIYSDAILLNYYDEKLAEKILSEMPDCVYVEGVWKSIETENFIFTATRNADDPYMYSVEKKINKKT
jgi:hypothetical protein